MHVPEAVRIVQIRGLAHCWIMAITSSPDTVASHKKVRFLVVGFVPLAEYQEPKAGFLDFPASS